MAAASTEEDSEAGDLPRQGDLSYKLRRMEELVISVWPGKAAG
jgi:hypothetical protein